MFFTIFSLITLSVFCVDPIFTVVYLYILNNLDQAEPTALLNVKAGLNWIKQNWWEVKLVYTV